VFWGRKEPLYLQFIYICTNPTSAITLILARSSSLCVCLAPTTVFDSAVSYGSKLKCSACYFLTFCPHARSIPCKCFLPVFLNLADPSRLSDLPRNTAERLLLSFLSSPPGRVCFCCVVPLSYSSRWLPFSFPYTSRLFARTPVIADLLFVMRSFG